MHAAQESERLGFLEGLRKAWDAGFVLKCACPGVCAAGYFVQLVIAQRADFGVYDFLGHGALLICLRVIPLLETMIDRGGRYCAPAHKAKNHA
jgi:hypothetical protein